MLTRTWVQAPSGLLVPEPAAAPRRRAKPVAIDFFAGAGGFSLGFHTAGFHVAAAVEYDLNAACTYLANLGGPETVIHINEPDRWPAWEKLQGDERRRWAEAGAPEGFGEAGTGWIATSDHATCVHPHEDIGAPPDKCMVCGWTAGGCGCGCARCVHAQPCEHFWIADVHKLTGAEILDALGMQRGEVDAVIGGPPCQGFSRMGKRDVMDPRNSLLFEFARLVLEIRPRMFVMENVPGLIDMVTPEGLPVLDAFARVIADGGFATYDALKRALKQQAGAFGTVRDDSGSQSSRKSDRCADPEDQEEQLDLFAEEVSAP